MTNNIEKPETSLGLPTPIHPVEQTYRMPEAGSDTRQYIGLDRNERVSPFPDWFMDKIRESVDSNLLTWYPTQDKLHRQLQEELGLAEEQLILTPSSDAAFKNLYQAYLNPGDGVVMLDPSYAMFPVYAGMFDAISIPITYSKDLELDNDLLLNSIVPGVRLVMLANPNQPTATLMDEGILLQVIEKAADVGALVAMDEAYYPFSGTTALPWLGDYPNLLVIRTFSKACGLAGMRIGFVAGHPEVINTLYKVRTVNDLNSMSVLCASKILEYPHVVDEYMAEVAAGKQVLESQVRELGLPVLPTHASFALIRVADRVHPVKLMEALKQYGYLVKTMDADCVNDCIRVTLGPPEIMSDFARCLGEALDSNI